MESWQPIIAWTGRIAGPLVSLALYWLLPEGAGLSHAGRAAAACGALMAVWWMSEAWPLGVTSLLPLVLFPLAGVYPVDPQPGDVVEVKLAGGEERPAVLVALLPADGDQPARATVDLSSPAGAERRTVPRASLSYPKPIARAAAPYANEYVFLYLAGFLIAFALEKWNLHRRMALHIMQIVGTRPALLVGGVMAATAFVSMWISNTATAAMMLPLGISLAALFDDRLRVAGQGESAGENAHDSRHFATALMLGIAYAATIGGMATIVGTPTNNFAVGFLREKGIEIAFADWLWIGLPVASVFLLVAWLLLTKVIFPVRLAELPDGERIIREELNELGPPSRGEWTVAAVFLATGLLWMVHAPLLKATGLAAAYPFLRTVDDVLIGLCGAIVLFFIPVDWEQGEFALDWGAAKRLPWDVLLLLGGGFALADGIQASGLDRWAGGQLQGLSGLPPWLLIALVSLAVVYLSELASNIATCIAVLPIAWAASEQLGVPPVITAVSVTLAASCGFMLPVATPPNAIAFGTGRIKVFEMIQAGFWLSLAGIAIVLSLTFLIGPWALPK